jgi:hypothetical protein
MSDTAVISIEKDIWDEEISPSTPNSRRDSPSIEEHRRIKRPLFLPDEDDDGEEAGQTPQSPNLNNTSNQLDDDIDKLFEFDDEELQITAPLDLDKLRKEADARNALNNIAHSLKPVDSSGRQSKDFFDKEADGKSKGNKGKILPKLDNERYKN